MHRGRIPVFGRRRTNGRTGQPAELDCIRHDTGARGRGHCDVMTRLSFAYFENNKRGHRKRLRAENDRGTASRTTRAALKDVSSNDYCVRNVSYASRFVCACSFPRPSGQSSICIYKTINTDVVTEEPNAPNHQVA